MDIQTESLMLSETVRLSFTATRAGKRIAIEAEERQTHNFTDLRALQIGHGETLVGLYR